MKSIIIDRNLVAYCGLYCGACRKYLQKKCPGCHENENASWCKIRSCCVENNYTSCASCREYPSPNDCKKFNNFISKLFGYVFKSDRAACIQKIKESGIEKFSEFMAEQGTHTIKKNK